MSSHYRQMPEFTRTKRSGPRYAQDTLANYLRSTSGLDRSNARQDALERQPADLRQQNSPLGTAGTRTEGQMQQQRGTRGRGRSRSSGSRCNRTSSVSARSAAPCAGVSISEARREALRCSMPNQSPPPWACHPSEHASLSPSTACIGGTARCLAAAISGARSQAVKMRDTPHAVQ